MKNQLKTEKHLTKKIYEHPISAWKDAQYQFYSEGWKLKPQWGTTSHATEDWQLQIM